MKLAGWMPASAAFRWGPFPAWRPAWVRIEGERVLVKGTAMAFVRGPLGYAFKLTTIRRANVSSDGRTLELRWRIRRVRLFSTVTAIRELEAQLRAAGLAVNEVTDSSK